MLPTLLNGPIQTNSLKFHGISHCRILTSTRSYATGFAMRVFVTFFDLGFIRWADIGQLLIPAMTGQVNPDKRMDEHTRTVVDEE